MSSNAFLVAALAAAARGWRVFPVVPAGKTPAVSGWQERATSDPQQIQWWWRNEAAMNIGIATGQSGLVVVDLDQGRGDVPPRRFAGARDGRDALAMLAAEAGAVLPTDTYTVSTPGGCHLYFRAPVGVELRCTAGTVGWRIDTRADGGFVVGAGSIRPDGSYRVIRSGPVAELPGWLLRALTPPPPELGPPRELPAARAGAYVRAIVAGEMREVANARTGTRHHTLLKAARTLGRLVGGGELAEDDARRALLAAASGHDGCGWLHRCGGAPDDQRWPGLWSAAAPPHYPRPGVNRAGRVPLAYKLIRSGLPTASTQPVIARHLGRRGMRGVRAGWRNGRPSLTFHQPEALASMTVTGFRRVGGEPMTAVETKTFGVRGLHCAGCATNVGNALLRIEGVIKAEADFDTAQVWVRFDPARVSDDDIGEGIRTAGFEPA
jgi:copper chaperone CopZ